MPPDENESKNHASPNAALNDIEPRAEVVTAFLWNGERILLMLRSESVTTYPGCWAGVSGYLEHDDPVEWALVEIDEETGLTRSQVTLRRRGEPLDIDDPSGRRYRVHPLLFSVPREFEIEIDWEASRAEWIVPEELLAGKWQPTVPRLDETLRRVWPPWPRDQAGKANLDQALIWLRNDRTLGAGSLARAAACEVAKLARLWEGEPLADARASLVQAIRQLAVVRPAMVSPANLLEDIEATLFEATTLEDFLRRVEQLVQQSCDAEELVAQHLADRIPPEAVVMTISYSRTVLRALQLAAERLGRVYVCEGRPLMEGRQLALRLQTRGVPVTLITDAAAGVHMPDVDLVLLGADAVLPNHAVVNKVGSGLLALAAREHHKRLLVGAEMLKFVRHAAQPSWTLECNSGDEVWRDAPAEITVSNVYFETIPAELVTEIVAEHQVAPRAADTEAVPTEAVKLP